LGGAFGTWLKPEGLKTPEKVGVNRLNYPSKMKLKSKLNSFP
jgi:hypothetical protein